MYQGITQEAEKCREARLKGIASKELQSSIGLPCITDD